MGSFWNPNWFSMWQLDWHWESQLWDLEGCHWMPWLPLVLERLRMVWLPHLLQLALCQRLLVEITITRSLRNEKQLRLQIRRWMVLECIARQCCKCCHQLKVLLLASILAFSTHILHFWHLVVIHHASLWNYSHDFVLWRAFCLLRWC